MGNWPSQHLEFVFLVFFVFLKPFLNLILQCGTALYPHWKRLLPLGSIVTIKWHTWSVPVLFLSNQHEVICVTAALLWDHTTLTSLHTPCASLSMRHSWSCRMPHSWWVLTNANWEHTTKLVILAMLWPSRLSITIWPLSKLFRSLCSSIFYQLKGQHSDLLLNISHPLTGATATT